MMENSRKKVRAFINAKHDYEVLFTKGTTEGINLVAMSIAHLIKENDEILITEIEHHSNIVPWQILSQKTGAKLKFIPLKQDGTLDMRSEERRVGTECR